MKKLHSLFTMFFRASPFERNNRYVHEVRNYIIACLKEMVRCDEFHDRGAVEFLHVFPDLDVTKTTMEFDRCFIAGSISGEVMSSSTSIQVSHALAYGMNQVANCEHGSDGNVYKDCGKDFGESAPIFQNEIRVVARLARAISNVVVYNLAGMTSLKNLCKATSILNIAGDVRYKWSQKFGACI